MISVVVPIYNEEELILRFHSAVANALGARFSVRTSYLPVRSRLIFMDRLIPASSSTKSMRALLIVT